MIRFNPVTDLAVIGTLFYLIFATGIVRADRNLRGRVFILNGILSFLIILPVALSMESFGHTFDFRNKRQMTKAIALCGALVFGMIFGVLSFARFIWHLPVAPN